MSPATLAVFFLGIFVMMKVIRAKLHGIRVTSADLNFHVSITLVPEQGALAGI